MLVSIVFDSGYGHTRKLVESAADGVKEVSGAEVSLVAVADGNIPWETLATSDAIIFASPTYNGSVSAKFKQFMEDSTGPVWMKQAWKNKVAAGITNSGAMHGDKMGTLITMTLFAAQHGMVWVGLDLFPGRSSTEMNRVGGWLGVMAQSDDAPPEVTPIESDRQTAGYLGKRVAELTRQFKAGV